MVSPESSTSEALCSRRLHSALTVNLELAEHARDTACRLVERLTLSHFVTVTLLC